MKKTGYSDMNILHALTRKKNVVGIEISDSLIRLAFFRASKKKPKRKKEGGDTAYAFNEELVLIEEPLEARVVTDGIVADKELLTKILRLLRTKIKVETNYAIVSIPDGKIYSRIFSFPKSVGEARLPEAMRLAINFQLPMQTERLYLDWEQVPGSTNTNEILLSTIDRTVAQDYMDALEGAGWKTLALESHLASIARAIKITPDQTTLFTKKCPDSTTVFALKNGSLVFSRALPVSFVPAEKIAAEVQNIKKALAASLKTPLILGNLMETPIRSDCAEYPALTVPKAKWLIALGAVIRGRIPEGQDKLISLLPVGTEEAYAYQKATVFGMLLRNLTVGISIFFVISYLGAYILILSLAQQANKTVIASSMSPVFPELLAKETVVNNTNAITKIAEIILKETPLWSSLLEELRARIINDIIISSFTANSIHEKILLVGVARNRNTLNNFKKNLQESPMLTEIELPLTNLDQKADIPFSVSFRIKDISTIYYK
jgi:Tfp pilus assembly PilM family ATPase